MTLYSLSTLAMVWIKLCCGLIPMTLSELHHCEGMLRGLSAAACCSYLGEEGKGDVIAGPSMSFEAISGNRTCHFPHNNSLLKTAAFALGQLRDPGGVREPFCC